MGEEGNGSGWFTFTDNDNGDTDWSILHSSTTRAYPCLLLSSGAHPSCKLRTQIASDSFLLLAIIMALDCKEHLCLLSAIQNETFLFLQQWWTAVLLSSVLFVSSLKLISEDQNTGVDSCLWWSQTVIVGLSPCGTSQNNCRANSMYNAKALNYFWGDITRWWLQINLRSVVCNGITGAM